MNKITWSLLLLLALAFSCREPAPAPGNQESYSQYGTPFQDIPPTEDIVMYEVNLRAFSAGGDLKGVTSRLDPIRDLGVNVIWLMPIHPIGQIKSVNSPYSVRNYKAIGAEYGSLADLRRLTDEAHARGIAVIMDWVANHTAWDHPWISNKSWYTQDASGNIIHPPGTNWLDVADLNYNNSDMRSAMIDAMKYWIYEANVDGYRCDHADGVPFDFWKQAFDSLATIPNRKLILFAEGTRADHFQAGFDLNFGWQFYGSTKSVYQGQPVSGLFSAHNQEYQGTPPGKHWVRFTTNHDESAWDATPIALFDGKDGALAASVATIFTGGIPLLYAGQEVGTAGNVPFFSNSTTNWNANPDMRQAYEDLLQFYRSSEVCRKGENTPFPHPDVLCLKKALGGEEVWILVNMRNQQVDFGVPAALQNTQWSDALTGVALSLELQLRMPSYSYYILKN